MRNSNFKVRDSVTKATVTVSACTLRHAIVVAAAKLNVPASRIILVEVSNG